MRGAPWELKTLLMSGKGAKERRRDDRDASAQGRTGRDRKGTCFPIEGMMSEVEDKGG